MFNKKRLYLIPLVAGILCAESEVNGLGDLAGGSFSSYATGVNEDGSVVVGGGTNASGFEAFRWTQAGGMVGLGDLVGGSSNSWALGVNEDGSVIVGGGVSALGFEAFRWTQAGGMAGLGDLAGGNFSSYATGVNEDGSVVVGSGSSASGLEAFRWTQAGGMAGLGDLAGGSFFSRALGVNADGSVVVGFGTTVLGTEAFRWTQAGGMAGLGDLAGGSFFSRALGINADGSVVVGFGTTVLGTEAFRWTQAGGMAGLGDLAGGSFFSRALGVNADGSVVVGFGTTASGTEAFRWTQAGGMAGLGDWLGISLAGWSDTRATDVNADGSVVVGSGTTVLGTEAFIAKSGSGLIGVQSYTKTLAQLNNIPQIGINITKMAFHNLIITPDTEKKYFILTNGNYGNSKNIYARDEFFSSGIGVGYKYSSNINYSVNYTKTLGTSKLLDSGKSKYSFEFANLETNIKIPIAFPVFLKLSYLAGKNSVDIDRGYLNGGNQDYSYGNTKQRISGHLIKLQVGNKDSLFRPFVEYNNIKVKTDGYTETKGGFPVQVNANKNSITDYSYGLDSSYKINTRNKLLFTVSGVHRTSNTAQGVSGRIIGLSAFAINGNEYKRNWVDTSLSLESTLNVGKLSLKFHSSNKGSESQYLISLNYSISF